MSLTVAQKWINYIVGTTDEVPLEAVIDDISTRDAVIVSAINKNVVLAPSSKEKTDDILIHSDSRTLDGGRVERAIEGLEAAYRKNGCAHTIAAIAYLQWWKSDIDAAASTISRAIKDGHESVSMIKLVGLAIYDNIPSPAQSK